MLNNLENQKIHNLGNNFLNNLDFFTKPFLKHISH